MAYSQRMIGVSTETYELVNALRRKGESFEKFFKRILPKMKKVSK
jgi:hypothetical protein